MSSTVRELAAELEVLARFDFLRSIAGHDYGAGQRTKELVRRRHELEARSVRSTSTLLDELTGAELVAALDRLEGPRLERIALETYRTHSTPTRKTVQTWGRLRGELESKLAAELVNPYPIREVA